MTSHQAVVKELGQRTDSELEAMFGDMYSGWDRGVNVTQERFGDGETRFTETPMTPLELAARYVAAEIGSNIYEIAGRSAFAPIIVYSQIQARIGPLFDLLENQAKALSEHKVAYDGLMKAKETFRAEAHRNAARALAAEARLAEAMRVIEPFAKAADDLDDTDKDAGHIWEAPCAMEITVGMLRAARAFTNAAKD